MDEQKARLGSMLADIELIGIPHRLVIGERGLDEGKIEYRDRTESENQHIEVENLMAFLADKLGD
jgi:prolyl-tRNA synthetase